MDHSPCWYQGYFIQLGAARGADSSLRQGPCHKDAVKPTWRVYEKKTTFCSLTSGCVVHPWRMAYMLAQAWRDVASASLQLRVCHLSHMGLCLYENSVFSHWRLHSSDLGNCLYVLVLTAVCDAYHFKSFSWNHRPEQVSTVCCVGTSLNLGIKICHY